MRTKSRTGDLFASPLPKPRCVAVPALPVKPHLVAAGRESCVASQQLWIAIRLKDLALPLHSSEHLPVVVVDLAGAVASSVLACNRLATRRGIGVGLSLNAAMALAPELCVQPREPEQEKKRLQQLAELATAFTPSVCIESADEVLLEVRASQRLFGGLDGLLMKLRDQLSVHHYRSVVAVAPTPEAALWFARAGDEVRIVSLATLVGRLNELPFEVTRWPDTLQKTLQQLGLRKLGDLVRLPRSGVAKRFTPQILLQLDQAYGRAASVRRHYILPQRFKRHLDLESEIDRQDFIEPVLYQLLDELSLFLQSRVAGISVFVVVLHHRKSLTTRLILRRSQVAGAGAEWRRLLSEQLKKLVLPSPVVAVSLRSGVITPIVNQSESLPGVTPAVGEANSAHLLLDRLRNRLGTSAITGLGLCEEHRPEAASRVMPPSLPGRMSAPVVPSPKRLAVAPRPLWLFSQARPLLERQGQPWLPGGLVLENGPERIESGWWDGADMCRDYYVARMASGARVWIYRDLKLAAGVVANHWYWHGVYA